MSWLWSAPRLVASPRPAVRQQHHSSWAMKSMQGCRFALKCNCRQEKDLNPYTIRSVCPLFFFFLGSSCKCVWLMVAVNIAFLPINRRKKGQQWFVCGRFACQRCLTSLLIMVLVLWVNSHYYPVCLKEVWTWPSLLNDKPYQRDEGSKEGKENEGGRRKTQFILNNWLHLSKHSLLAQWSSETKSMPTAKKKKKKSNRSAHFHNSGMS